MDKHRMKDSGRKSIDPLLSRNSSRNSKAASNSSAAAASSKKRKQPTAAAHRSSDAVVSSTASTRTAPRNQKNDAEVDHDVTNASLARSTTRLCIKNLPPHYAETDLKKFIFDRVRTTSSGNSSSDNDTSPFLITDCRILKSKEGKSRRMAFVGFAPSKSSTTARTATATIPSTLTTAESIAQHVLTRLDKSYCGTAKLLVEFAVLPQTKSVHGNAEAASTVAGALEKATTKQEKAKGRDDDTDAKKREFLAVMGVKETAKASSGGAGNKVWSNDAGDDGAGTNDKDAGLEDDDGHVVRSKNDSQGAMDNDDSDDDDDNDDDEESEDDADPLLSRQHEESKRSAMDFLRSKQVTEIELKEELDNELDVENDDNGDNDDDDEIDNDEIDGDDENDDAVPMKGSMQAQQSEHDRVITATKTSQEHAKMNDDNDVVDEEDRDDGDDENDAASSTPTSNNRLFLRNLPFTATEDDIRHHLQSFGTITECHIPVDDRYQNKGFAFVSFESPSAAQAALAQADGRDFQGRLLHIIPARHAPSSSSNATNDGDKSLTYKEKMSQMRQQGALSSQKGWMASFVRGDAVVDNLAERLGLRKGDILSIKDDLSSGDAAVRLALGETAVIEENRAYFANHGINMEALVSLGTGAASADGSSESSTIERSKTALLVKNLPHDTTKDDLQQVFQGNNVSILLPPSRTIAVVEYSHVNDAKVAFRKLAYRRFKSVPLYLEWVPLAASKGTDPATKRPRDETTDETVDNAVDESGDNELSVGPTFTVYVKNLSFSTTEDALWKFFEKYTKDVRAVRIPQKVAAVKRQGDDPQMQSMGFGFVELGSKDSVRTVLKTLQGSMLDGHALELKPSMAGANDAAQSSKSVGAASDKAPCKLMVRNVPFQATRKELLQLFGSFGTLKKVRLPKKFDGSHRGFAFIEYLTGKEAAHAMKVLSRTHLYGRHLVIEWASPDEEVDDIQVLREKAERDVAPKGKKIRFD